VTVATQPAVALGTRTSGGDLTTPAVRLEAVRKMYGDVTAVADIDLDIATGEFFSMLGPAADGRSGRARRTGRVAAAAL
jgi:ABC-type transporter Mla maintaining outer membrane lipid asymmetry ATPase subunit MlaF